MKSFTFAALASVAAAINNTPYNNSQAQIALYLSEYAYCGHAQYDQITFGYAATGF